MQSPTTAKPPSRRPAISREFLENHRRRRYVDATAELLHEFGRQGATVSNIVRLAGTARNSYYEVFGGTEDCIAYAIGVAVGELLPTLAEQDGRGEWSAEVHAAISAFYAAVAAEPLLAEVFLIHAPASRVEQGRATTLAATEAFGPLFGRGRAEAQALGLRPAPPLADELFSRAVVSLAARRVRKPEVVSLPGEARAMGDLVIGFYLGSAAGG
jgi:AcrR family transcriptional regulator